MIIPCFQANSGENLHAGSQVIIGSSFDWITAEKEAQNKDNGTGMKPSSISLNSPTTLPKADVASRVMSLS